MCELGNRHSFCWNNCFPNWRTFSWQSAQFSNWHRPGTASYHLCPKNLASSKLQEPWEGSLAKAGASHAPSTISAALPWGSPAPQRSVGVLSTMARCVWAPHPKWATTAASYRPERVPWPSVQSTPPNTHTPRPCNSTTATKKAGKGNRNGGLEG